MDADLHFDYTAEAFVLRLRKKIEKHAWQSVSMMSGGERSFATVAFILSVWDCVPAPVKILDEFDIFMDVVARTQAMKMILDKATNCCQYVIVSPLRYDETERDNVNVFRLENPRA